MFKKRWPWLGKIISDEGFEISFAHKSVDYSDHRGKFEFGYEDGLLFTNPHQVSGPTMALSQFEIDQMIKRVVQALTSEDIPVEVFRKGAEDE